MARLGARSTSVGWANHLSASALVLLPTAWPGGGALIPTVYMSKLMPGEVAKGPTASV